MGDSPTTRITIPSDAKEVAKVQQVIMPLVEEAGFDKDAIFAIRLAVDEAVANAIHHGNKDQIEKQVTIDYAVTPNKVHISVCDEGPGFCPDNLPDPTCGDNLLQPHGRGVLLIQAYMTEAEYSDKGRCLKMTKTKGCKKPQLNEE